MATKVVKLIYNVQRMKRALMQCGQRKSRSECASMQSEPGIPSLSKYTTISIHSVSGNEGPDQPAQMHRLIRACVIRVLQKRSFRAITSYIG